MNEAEQRPLVVPDTVGDDDDDMAEDGGGAVRPENTARNARLNVLQEAVPWGANTNLWVRVSSSLLVAPQVLIAAVVLFTFSENCILDAHSMSLRTWIIGDALQKTLQLCTLLFLFWVMCHAHKGTVLIWFPVVVHRRGLQLSRRQLRTMRFLVLWNDVFAIVWLVQGSTLFSSPNNEECREVHAPHVYNLGLAMLILSMLAISLPLIMCAAMVPLVCFCLPCFIRVILAARAARPKGASPERLANLPSVVYEPNTLLSGEANPSCAICLAGYVPGEELRCLPCDERHQCVLCVVCGEADMQTRARSFHRKCVDDWLLLNASWCVFFFSNGFSLR